MEKTLTRFKKELGTAHVYLILVLAAVIFIYPTLWIYLAALKPGQELYQKPWALPNEPTLTNFINAWRMAHLGRAFINSGIITFASVTLILLVSIYGAFAIGQMKFRGRKLIYFIIILGIMVPVEGLILPIFLTLKTYGFLNSYFGVILPYAALGVPFTFFVLVNFFKKIPKELTDAALIDGASRSQLLWRIIIPLSLPAISGTGIFQGALVWNELIVSLTVLQREELFTVPLTLATFLRKFVREWSLTFSTLSLSIIPILVVYIIFSRHFVRGMTVGALKG
jgi:raffinose/stachyose/melibiose transport system permease protein